MKIEIKNSLCPVNPRLYDYTDCNIGKMICLHGKYLLGDKHKFTSSDFNSWDDMREQLKKQMKTDVILPLYLYNHSVLTISTKPFHCPWDSGQVGFIVLDKTQVEKVYGWKRLTTDRKNELIKVLIAEVELYDKYLTGDVYDVFLLNSNQEEVDVIYDIFLGDDVNSAIADLLNTVDLKWNNPDSIDGNNYKVQKVFDANEETAKILYGEGEDFLSEAEVYISELSLLNN